MPKNPNLVSLRQLRALPANSSGSSARVLLLAYCLLRGRTIDRIESPNSDPYAFPYPGTVADLAAKYHRPAEEGVSAEEHAATVKAFREQIAQALLAWKKQLYLNWAELEIKKRARNAARQPHAHRPRPADLASRGA